MKKVSKKSSVDGKKVSKKSSVKGKKVSKKSLSGSVESSKKKRTKSQSSKLARQRGHNFEREIAGALRACGLFPDAQRHLEYQKHQATGVDIDNTGPFAFQCKRGRTLHNPVKALDEIKSDHAFHCCVAKADHGPIIVSMEFTQFIELLKAVDFDNIVTY